MDEINTLSPLVQTKKFVDTSSSELELLTLLWALDIIPSLPNEFSIYTDSQSITKLPQRRGKLEANNYLTKAQLPLKHKELYQQFFVQSDQYNFNLFKVKGHQPSSQKSKGERIFGILDREVRKTLRNHIRVKWKILMTILLTFIEMPILKKMW